MKKARSTRDKTAEVSRRDLAFLLPTIAVAHATAQEPNTAASQPPARPLLASRAYDFNELPIHSSSNGTMKSRPVFDGVTTRGQRLTLHVSELAPGQAPHAPARQAHEEVIIIREGTLEVTLDGRTSTLGPGSVIFSAFRDLNGWKNFGTTPAQYYVLSLEEHSA